MRFLKAGGAFLGVLVGLALVFDVVQATVVAVVGTEGAARMYASPVVRGGQALLTVGGAGYAAYVVWTRDRQ